MDYVVTTEAPKSWVDGRTGRRVGLGHACIYLQCASDLVTGELCKNEIFIVPKKKVDGNDVVNSISDERAAELFTNRGWSINPTHCPECIAKLQPADREPKHD